MAENENVNTAPSKGKIKIIALALLFIVVATGAGAGFWFYKAGKIPFLKPTVKKEKYKTVEIGDLTVSLSGSGGAHYLRVVPVIECQEKKPLLAEIAEKKYEIKDAMITVLRAKDIQQVRSVDYEEQMKQELLDAINDRLDSGEVERLYFTEYMVQ